jgi:hypothetical protein
MTYLALAGALPLGACLLPQAIEFEPDGGPAVNRPPRIVAELVEPRAPVIRIGEACADPPDLVVGGVIEEDLNDVLEARWFADYSLEATRRRTENIGVDFIPPEAEPTARRTGPGLRAHPTNIGGLGTHLVEVVVSERESFDDANTNLPERAMKSPCPPTASCEAVVYRWAVEIVPGSECPP